MRQRVQRFPRRLDDVLGPGSTLRLCYWKKTTGLLHKSPEPVVPDLTEVTVDEHFAAAVRGNGSDPYLN